MVRITMVPGGNFFWSDLVRFGQIWYPWYLAAIFVWSDLVFGTLGTWRQFVFGQIWSDLVPSVPGGIFFGHIWSDLVPLVPGGIFFWSDLVFGTLGTWRQFVFGQIWSDLVRFGPMVPLVPRGIFFDPF